MSDFANEIGTASTAGPPNVSREVAEGQLSEALGREIGLPQGAVVSGPPSCPACGTSEVIWGCDQRQTRMRDQIHPVVWHETQWMADSWVCLDCNAGWIQPDDPGVVTWARPYWRI
jgi:hypothetical protein